VPARQTRCAELVRGGASSAERRREPSLGLVRSAQRTSLWRRAPARLVSPCRPRKGADEGKGGGRIVISPSQNEESKQLAVGARASSYCRSRQNVLGLREARHRYRLGRKPGRYHGASEREPDHRRSLRCASAGAHRRQKGGGSSKLGDPHHVSAVSSLRAARFRSCFGAGGMRAGIYRRKAPWIGEAHAFHEVPAEPVLAASEQPSGIRRKAKPGGGTEEATGVSEAVGLDVTRRKKTPSCDPSSGR